MNVVPVLTPAEAWAIWLKLNGREQESSDDYLRAHLKFADAMGRAGVPTKINAPRRSAG
jgi:hypothetical protein